VESLPNWKLKNKRKARGKSLYCSIAESGFSYWRSRCFANIWKPTLSVLVPDYRSKSIGTNQDSFGPRSALLSYSSFCCNVWDDLLIFAASQWHTVR